MKTTLIIIYFIFLTKSLFGDATLLTRYTGEKANINNLKKAFMINGHHIAIHFEKIEHQKEHNSANKTLTLKPIYLIDGKQITKEELEKITFETSLYDTYLDGFACAKNTNEFRIVLILSSSSSNKKQQTITFIPHIWRFSYTTSLDNEAQEVFEKASYRISKLKENSIDFLSQETLIKKMFDHKECVSLKNITPLQSNEFLNLEEIINQLQTPDANHSYSEQFIHFLLQKEPINDKNYLRYILLSDLLIKYSQNLAAITILQELIAFKPNYLPILYANLADCYWEIEEVYKSQDIYFDYILLMNQAGLSTKIPEYVHQRIENKIQHKFYFSR